MRRQNHNRRQVTSMQQNVQEPIHVPQNQRALSQIPDNIRNNINNNQNNIQQQNLQNQNQNNRRFQLQTSIFSRLSSQRSRIRINIENIRQNQNQNPNQNSQIVEQLQFDNSLNIPQEIVQDLNNVYIEEQILRANVHFYESIFHYYTFILFGILLLSTFLYDINYLASMMVLFLYDTLVILRSIIRSKLSDIQQVKKKAVLILIENTISILIKLMVIVYVESNLEKSPIPIIIFCLIYIALRIKIYYLEKDFEDINSVVNFFICLIRTFYVLLIFSISLKNGNIVDWTWRETFWSFWIIFAVFAGITFVLFIMLLNKLFQLCFQDAHLYELKGLVWSFYNSTGLTLCSCMSILSIIQNLENNSVKMVRITFIIVIIYTLIYTIINILWRKDLMFYLQNLIAFTPDQIEILKKRAQQNRALFLSELGRQLHLPPQQQNTDNNTENSTNINNQYQQNQDSQSEIEKSQQEQTQEQEKKIDVPRFLQKFSGTFFKKLDPQVNPNELIRKQQEEKQKKKKLYEEQQKKRQLEKKQKEEIINQQKKQNIQQQKNKKTHTRSISSINFYKPQSVALESPILELKKLNNKKSEAQNLLSHQKSSMSKQSHKNSIQQHKKKTSGFKFEKQTGTKNIMLDQENNKIINFSSGSDIQSEKDIDENKQQTQIQINNNKSSVLSNINLQQQKDSKNSQYDQKLDTEQFDTENPLNYTNDYNTDRNLVFDKKNPINTNRNNKENFMLQSGNENNKKKIFNIMNSNYKSSGNFDDKIIFSDMKSENQQEEEIQNNKESFIIPSNIFKTPETQNQQKNQNTNKNSNYQDDDQEEIIEFEDFAGDDIIQQQQQQQQSNLDIQNDNKNLKNKRETYVSIIENPLENIDNINIQSNFNNNQSQQENLRTIFEERSQMNKQNNVNCRTMSQIEIDKQIVQQTIIDKILNEKLNLQQIQQENDINQKHKRFLSVQYPNQHYISQSIQQNNLENQNQINYQQQQSQQQNIQQQSYMTLNQSQNLQNQSQFQQSVRQDQSYISNSVINKSTVTCLVCFDKQPDAVYMECGHGGICYDCSLEVWKATGECYLCRDPIQHVLQVDLNKKQGHFIKVLSSTQMVRTQEQSDSEKENSNEDDDDGEEEEYYGESQQSYNQQQGESQQQQEQHENQIQEVQEEQEEENY